MENKTREAILNVLKDEKDAAHIESALAAFSDASHSLLRGKLFLELTEQLRNSLLREVEAQKKIGELRDQFIFVAAHDLRAPVTSINYSLSVLDDEKEQLSENGREFLAAIKDSSERLKNLVNDLLDIARLEAGKMRMVVVQFVIDDEMKKIVKEMQALAKADGITLRYTIDDEGATIVSDPQRLKEVMANLITNGIKYNKPGGTVYVSVKRQETGFHFEVRDEGLGFSDEEKTHVFEKFWRSKEVEKKTGTGLGLFIVKKLVEKLGGNIVFNSKKGEGTTFYFILPTALSIDGTQ